MGFFAYSQNNRKAPLSCLTREKTKPLLQSVVKLMILIGFSCLLTLCLQLHCPSKAKASITISCFAFLDKGAKVFQFGLPENEEAKVGGHLPGCLVWLAPCAQELMANTEAELSVAMWRSTVLTICPLLSSCSCLSRSLHNFWSKHIYQPINNLIRCTTLIHFLSSVCPAHTRWPQSCGTIQQAMRANIKAIKCLNFVMK